MCIVAMLREINSFSYGIVPINLFNKENLKKKKVYTKQPVNGKEGKDTEASTFRHKQRIQETFK